MLNPEQLDAGPVSFPPGTLRALQGPGSPLGTLYMMNHLDLTELWTKVMCRSVWQSPGPKHGLEREGYFWEWGKGLEVLTLACFPPRETLCKWPREDDPTLVAGTDMVASGANIIETQFWMLPLGTGCGSSGSPFTIPGPACFLTLQVIASNSNPRLEVFECQA